VVRGLTPDPPPELLVGLATGDDAAVWRIGRGRALVLTADFITPVVDDARAWGRIAATNAVSDVYAMGGRPLLALNLVAWNSGELSNDLLAEVLAGGEDAARAGGFVVGGGHTVDDPEPKYGMAVVGEVDPGRMLTNAGLRPGNALVLTKPLGSGVISTAIKRAEARPEVVDRAVAEMTRSNEAAAAAAMRHGATAATDVTGFGLAGHLVEMLEASGTGTEIEIDRIPLYAGAADCVAAGVESTLAPSNREHLQKRWKVDSGPGAADAAKTGTEETAESVAAGPRAAGEKAALLFDPQTSGGLLAGVPSFGIDDVVARLRDAGYVQAACIGRVTDRKRHLKIF